MSAKTNNQRADRFPTPLKVYCSFERVEGIATLINISYTGALLTDTEMRPEIGTRVQLYVHLKPPCAIEPVAPSALVGVVARHTSDGFAIMFEDDHDPDIREMVDNATGVVITRR
jgi:hypothetical protein